MPRGAPCCVGQMYYRFGESIRTESDCQSNLAEAVRIHRFIDAIQTAPDQAREVAVA